MQITSVVDPDHAPDPAVAAPGRRRRSRHEPRMCAACGGPLASQEDACSRCGARVPEPVLMAVPAAPRAPTAPLSASPLATPPAPGPADAVTPLWTRHTRGAIEGDRDRRIERRTRAPVVYRSALNGPASVAQADFARERWVDDGGSFDREAAAALRASTGRR
jgi:hypothetical protein